MTPLVHGEESAQRNLQRVILPVSLTVAAALGLAAAKPQLAPAALMASALFAALAAVGFRLDAVILGIVALRPLVDGFVRMNVGGGVTLGKLWGVSLIGACCLYLLTPRDRVDSRMPGLGIVLGFLALFALLATLRGDAALGISMALKACSWLLLVFVVERIAHSIPGRRSVIVAAVVAGWLLTAVVAYLQSTGRYGSGYYSGTYVEDQGIGQGPHGLASLAVMLLPVVSLGLVAFRRRAVVLGAMVLLCGVVGLSLVRTAYVGLAVVLTGVVVGLLRQGSVQARATALALVGAALFVFFEMRASLLQRVSDLTAAFEGGTRETSSVVTRLDLWSSVWHRSTASLAATLVGRGSGSSLSDGQVVAGAPLWPHNDWFELLATGGLLLVTCYVVVQLWLVFSIVSSPTSRSNSGLARMAMSVGVAAWVAYLMMSILNGMLFYQSSIGLALLVGLLRGLGDESSRLGTLVTSETMEVPGDRPWQRRFR